MKTSLLTVVLFSTLLNVQAQTGNVAAGTNQLNLAQDTPYVVVERDANSRVWQRTTYETTPTGQIVSHVHHYTELAPGLNYQKDGQWTESKEQIEIVPTGGAAATQGQHQVYFPADIYNGVLEVVTPDGRHLKSRPLAVSYDDGSNTVFIATLKHSQGWLTSSNQVTYRDAFTDLKADIVCTYRRSGFECDLVFREQPPTPETFGLNGATSTLQLVTEFFNTADPQEVPATSDEWFALQDNSLKFGQLIMTQGRAFAVAKTNSVVSTRTPVYKRWLHLEGRTFLVEEVPLINLASDFNTLPGATNASASTLTGKMKVASDTCRMPPSHDVIADTKPIQVASANFAGQPGVVLDYNEINGGLGDYTFQDGETYYINSSLGYINGTATFESGAVIKYSYGSSLMCFGTLISPSNPDRPVILTSADDDTVGEAINGSSGNPQSSDSFYLQTTGGIGAIKNFRFYYPGGAIWVYGGTGDSLDFWNCEFLHCDGVLSFDDYSLVPIGLHNVLMVDCGIAIGDGLTDSGQMVTGEHVTADVQYFISGSDIDNLLLFNSIIRGSMDLFSGTVNTDSVQFNPSGTVFRTGGNANYYLADDTYRNVGTTLVDTPSVLTDIATMTTYAPQDGAYPDSDRPDLGYHYPANEDSDFDGLPDWWEWSHFGNFSVNANDVDAAGNTLLYDYQHSITPLSLFFVSRPLAQDVLTHDFVTFSVTAKGRGPISYQWKYNGVNIPGGTSSSYTIKNVVQGEDDGTYSVTISNGSDSLSSEDAQLTVESSTDDPTVMYVLGPRQDYEFKGGVTYVIQHNVQLYGNTVIDGGAIIKFFPYPDPNHSDLPYGDDSLQIMGTLTCNTKQYYPAILTTVDDPTVGAFLPLDQQNDPQPYFYAAPYLDMTYASNSEVKNLRFICANVGVTVPAASRKLDVWDCQFLGCESAIDCEVGSDGGLLRLHNVLFSGVGTEYAIASLGNNIEIDGEQVTADVAKFSLALGSGGAKPSIIALTNCIIKGALGDTLSSSLYHSDVNASAVFQTGGAGNYYLPAGSSYRHAGTASISPELAAELHTKTTTTPVALPGFLENHGDITLSPQVPRYTNGAPDMGFYYDVMDYTVAGVTNWGTITVLPGTSIGYRLDTKLIPGLGELPSLIGFVLRENSSFVSQGTPEKPNIFVDSQLVQEQLQWPVWAGFVPQLVPEDGSNPTDADSGAAPSLDLRFSEFYVDYTSYYTQGALGITRQIWAGCDADGSPGPADFSAVSLYMRDCKMQGGRIEFGEPYSIAYTGDASVTLINNSFEDVSINFCPTLYANPDDGTAMSFAAYNNLFKGGLWFHLQAFQDLYDQDWILENNLFDGVNIVQDWVSGFFPLDYDHNGYWPLTERELELPWSSQYWGSASTPTLQPTATGDGFSDGLHEVVLSTPPAYQKGPFGDFYLPNGTGLYGGGSGTPADMRFYHYTTRLDQVKEGEDTSKPDVNIGVHYVGAISPASAVSQDYDHDGIPDYVENWHEDGDTGSGRIHTADETDWKNPITDAVNPDASNAVYMDIDLSGDGIAGLIKKQLGMKPFDTSNPFVITNINMIAPGVYTLELPISYSFMSSFGGVNLTISGDAVTFDNCTAAPDGNCLIRWNSTFDPPGQKVLQVQFGLNAPAAQELIGTTAGPVRVFNSNNLLQFFEGGTRFTDTDAYLDALLFSQNATYSIDLYDISTGSKTWITTIGPNDTDNGQIQEDWGVTYSDGMTPYTGNTVEAVFNVTAKDSAGNPLASQSVGKILQRVVGSLSESGPNIDFAYLYMPILRPLPQNPFDKSDPSQRSSYAKGGQVWNAMQAIVNQLMDPQFGHDTYGSYFNRYNPDPCEEYPGYIINRSPPASPTCLWSDMSVVGTLLPNLAMSQTRQFYIDAHGSPNELASADGNVWIMADEVAGALTNRQFISSPDGSFNAVVGNNPYRFVFLDACYTAKTKQWFQSFGITPDNNQFADRNQVGPQAFMGWEGVVGENLYVYEQSITTLFLYTQWMNGNPLAECIGRASDPHILAWPLPVRGNESVTASDGSAVQQLTGKLIIVGHSGLKFEAVPDASFDGKYRKYENADW